MKTKQITIRNVTAELDAKLKALSKTRGESVNSTILYLLEQALGENPRRRRLERYVTWSRQDREEFDEALRAQRQIDEDIWK